MPAPRPFRPTTTRSPASKRRSKATTTPRSKPVPRYHFIGGKGGVGKTTCAAAMAIDFARRGARTLVLSTDPAPSLGDALNHSLSTVPRRVPLPRAELFASEIDSRVVLRRWLRGRQHTLMQIAVRGTWLDEEDVSRLLELSLPGIDEIAALLEISRLARRTRYQQIVVDTAPTGHTLRMLRLPATLRAIAAVFDRMQSKHRVMVAAIRGEWTADAADALVTEIEREALDVAALLRDPASTDVSWVALPEMMAVEETADAVAALSAEGIPLHRIIVNRLTPPPVKRCSWCDRRRTIEADAVEQLDSRLRDTPRVGIAARMVEPRGWRSLAAIGEEIHDATAVRSGRQRASVSEWRAPVSGASSRLAIEALVRADRRIVWFGGKGGVGKTTCAAAAAVFAASEHPDRSVLLLSTDPAHSLADVLGSAVLQPEARPGPHLRVREIDAVAHFEALRVRYAAAIDALFERIGGSRQDAVGVDISHDREVMHALLDLAPPGMDEVAAIVDVIDAVQSDGAELIVLDTAPTGHALRLLEMPALVQEWTRAIMAILLKYRTIAPLGEFGPGLLNLSRGLSRFRALLIDASRTSFVVVTRGAALPREETVRLLSRLGKLHIHVPCVVINATGRGECPRCRREAAVEKREIARFVRERPADIPIVVAPAQLPPPHGAARLLAWGRTWRPRSSR